MAYHHISNAQGQERDTMLGLKTNSLDIFDRFFPSQDEHTSEKRFGNLIALPLQGVAANDGNTIFGLIHDNIFRPVMNQ